MADPKHTALDVADQFIRWGIAEENLLTHLKVQKLVYFAHSWSLGLGYGSLIQDAVEAWQFGPVIRMLYHRLKENGGQTIGAPLRETPAEFDEGELAVMRAIWRHYGEIPAESLSAMTHAQGSPWEQVYSTGRGSQIIQNHRIRDYYADLAEANRNRAAARRAGA